ncbi:hypothetical protein CC78DRAFT_471880 [Lojkania enalia]|uniref:Transcription regulator Rua1 C-terminal domain-containing protein n=1 Tax=Lojkania enalia TaxID=147567 RepID=A0A9P4K7D7_9PLEO|nr:hypothetical protein CC78DRAFT_471880 [Didymosphaeria enalia]
MNPEDTSLTPEEQAPRFEGDIYTSHLVRGHGNKREGWCGFCISGRWLELKNSAFWYDKSFNHGINITTGRTFSGPATFLTLNCFRCDEKQGWEALCNTCNKWIPFVSSNKKGITWYRHDYKVCK